MAASCGVAQDHGRVLFGGEGLAICEPGNGAWFSVLQMRFDGGDHYVLLVVDEVCGSETQAAGSVDHDALVKDPVEQINEFSAGRLAHESHVSSSTSFN
jgi:hypothetical protein